MSRLHLSAPLLLTALLWPSLSPAQQDQGTITGQVIDPAGAVIPGATVTASAVGTGVSTQTVTNSEGLYTLTSLSIGRYRIGVERPGFKRSVSDVVEVHAQSRVRVDFQLELGALADEVFVAARALLLETETSSLSHVIPQEQIRELPLNGRNFQQLAVLAAGVLPAFAHADREGGFNSHGQWASQNKSSTAWTTTRTSWGCKTARRRSSSPTSMPCWSFRSRRPTIPPSSGAMPAP